MSETEQEVIEDAEVEEIRNLPAVRASEAVVARGELSVDEVVEQKDKIEQVMKRVMKEGVHYGLIPGVNKPSLFKPGAEAIDVALRLAPHYQSEKIWHEDGHLTVVAKCELQHIPTSLIVGTGEGLCTSRETRYAYRKGVRVCPNCGAAQIKRSKFKPKAGDYDGADPDNDEPGWYCWKKEGGCGMNFAADDQRIISQEEGKVANPDIADTYNTVLKMADKRALIAAVLNATAASDIFTQDVEDNAATATAEAESEVKEEAKEERPFDPGKDLLPGAIEGRGSKANVERLEAILVAANDRIDWKAVIGAATRDSFAVARSADLDAKGKAEWWLRLRNAVRYLEQLQHPELGASPEQIKEAFAQAFDLNPKKVAIVMLPPPDDGDLPNPEIDQEAVDAVPFGE